MRDGSALGGLGNRARIAALGDTRRLAGAATQIIKLGAPNDALADDLDRIDVGRIEREHTLDAFAERNLTDGEAAAHALVRARDAHALIGLDTAAFAFDHLHADLERIARTELGDRALFRQRGNLLGFELLDEVHLILPLRAARQREAGPARRCGAPKGPV